MANYQAFKTPVFAGINDTPIAPNSVAAGNGSDLIDRTNALADILEDDVTLLEPLKLGTTAIGATSATLDATANSKVVIIANANPAAGIIVTLPTTPVDRTFVELFWSSPEDCTLTPGTGDRLYYHNGTAFVDGVVSASATFAGTGNPLGSALCVYLAANDTWYVSGAPFTAVV